MKEADERDERLRRGRGEAAVGMSLCGSMVVTFAAAVDVVVNVLEDVDDGVGVGGAEWVEGVEELLPSAEVEVAITSVVPAFRAATDVM